MPDDGPRLNILGYNMVKGDSFCVYLRKSLTVRPAFSSMRLFKGLPFTRDSYSK